MPKHDPFGAELPMIETERLVLRHPQKTDADNLFILFSDSVAMRYGSHEPWTERDAADAYIHAIELEFRERSRFRWAITVPKDDRLIGTVTLMNWDRTNRHAEVGYMLAPAMWGKGYASEAVCGVLGLAFGCMQLHRVEAEVDPRNEASVRLLERLGFKREGLLRDRWFLYDEWCDSGLYGLLRKDFKATT